MLLHCKYTVFFSLVNKNNIICLQDVHFSKPVLLEKNLVSPEPYMNATQAAESRWVFFKYYIIKTSYCIFNLCIMFMCSSINFRSDLVAAELEKIKRFNCIL